MTIFITGGAGLIDSNFLFDWLSESDEPVINFDKLTYAGNLKNLARLQVYAHHVFVQGALSDRTLVDALLAQYCPRAVLHFAAEGHVDRSIHGPEDFIQTNNVCTFRLLETLRSYWSALPGAEKAAFPFPHSSTYKVYGTLSKEAPPFAEANAYEPYSPNSASKAASDHLVRTWHHTHGLSVLTTNCSNNYGPHHFLEKLIPLLIVNALADKPLPVYDDGMQISVWLFVKGQCSDIRRVLEAGRLGETYSVGSWNEMPNIEIVHTVCALLHELRPKADGSSYATQITHIQDRPGHNRRDAIDARKIECELGGQPAETFETGIRKTEKWYLDNPEWVTNVQSGAYRDSVIKQYMGVAV